MGKTKLILLSLAGALIIYVIWFYTRIWYFIKTYKYRYEITKVDAGGVKSFSDLTAGSGFFDVFFNFFIGNISPYKTSVKDLKIDFYYKKLYIGKSYNFGDIEILPEAETLITGKARIYVNKALLNMLIVGQKKTILLEYVASFRPYGLPFTVKYKDVYEINLSDYITL